VSYSRWRGRAQACVNVIDRPMLAVGKSLSVNKLSTSKTSVDAEIDDLDEGALFWAFREDAESVTGDGAVMGGTANRVL